MGARPMSMQDTLWLHMDRPNNLMVIDSLAWTNRRLPARLFRQVIQERMLERYPVFSQRLVPSRIPGLPALWEDDPDFDLERHLVITDLPTPATQEALQDYVSAQRSRPMPRDRPLWEAHLLRRYGAGSALLFRFHHSIADGVRLTQLVLSLCDSDGEPLPAATSSRRGGARKGLVRKAVDFGLNATGLTDAVTRLLPLVDIADASAAAAIAHGKKSARAGRTVGEYLMPRGGVPRPWRSAPQTEKRVVWSDGIGLDAIKAHGHATASTVNEVCLSLVGGTMHRYFSRHGERVRGATWLMPVNLKPFDQNLPRDLGNFFAVAPIRLDIGEADHGRRLDGIRKDLRSLRDSHIALLAFGGQRVASQTPQQLATFLTNTVANKAVGVLTNVPGPRSALTFAGVRVDGVVGWAPCTGRQPLTVCIFTYAGELRMGFAADTHVIPDIELLLDCLRAEVAEALGE